MRKYSYIVSGILSESEGIFHLGGATATMKIDIKLVPSQSITERGSGALLLQVEQILFLYNVYSNV